MRRQKWIAVVVIAWMTSVVLGAATLVKPTTVWDCSYTPWVWPCWFADAVSQVYHAIVG